MSEFKSEIAGRVAGYADNQSLRDAAAQFLVASVEPKYSYNFHWMDRPIIQYPQDLVAFQEIVWSVKPDLIIETGIAHGGSLILSASLLAMIDYCEAAKAGTTLDPAKPKRKVVGVDIDIRAHNRSAIDAHPMRPRITLVEGSSVAPDIASEVAAHAEGKKRVLVCLDSNHTHDHVREELRLYAPLVSHGSYCIVFDTLIEDMPENAYPDRPWSKGDNPKTAVWEFLKDHPEFEIDKAIHEKLMITVAPDGFLKRTGA